MLKRIDSGEPPPRRLMHLRTVSGKGGGPEKTLLTTPQYLPGYDVRLVYIRPENDPEYSMPERAQAMGVQLVDIAERHGFDVRTVSRLSQEIREFQPQILHPHDYKTNILAVLLGARFRIPVVTTVHGFVAARGRLKVYYHIDRWAVRRCRHVIAVSEDLADYARHCGVSEDCLTVVPNAIDTRLFRRQKSTAAARLELGFRPEAFLVGSIARLAEEKRFDLLIQAVGGMIDKGQNVELAIAGDGAQRPQLERLIARQSQPDRFHLLGYRSDTIELLQALDAFALTSDREGLPNSLLEAMAMQVPVVATKVAGIPSLIQHGQNGLLAEPGRPDVIQSGLQLLYEDEQLGRRLAAAARQTIEETYDFASRMKKIERIYDKLLQGQPDLHSGEAETSRALEPLVR